MAQVPLPHWLLLSLYSAALVSCRPHAKQTFSVLTFHSKKGDRNLKSMNGCLCEYLYVHQCSYLFLSIIFKILKRDSKKILEGLFGGRNEQPF